MAQKTNHKPTRIFCVCMALLMAGTPYLGADQTRRRTPLVQAIENCRNCVVNLRGQKTISEATNGSLEEQTRHVNGMGTGVVIDPRGYILTNFHVVQDIRTIQVTTRDRQTTTARIIARDPATDLAILKIDTPTVLEPIRLGTSSDLMLAETVAAVGNAYGYEHTVTTGIISHLKRTVQINEDQIYENLIQTDASINPGNSGGPLLNVDGEMIGINVAVRVGAQGIAFAIPVNEAMEVAARLMAEVANARVDSGLMVTTQFVENEAQMRVAQVVAGSAADQAGIKIGDQIHSINGTFASRSLDWYRAIVEARVGTTLQVGIRNETGEKTVSLTLEGVQTMSLDAVAWSSLGMKFSVATDAEMSGRHPNYQRGLKVMAVRSGSPAEKEGIKAGDILVAMHGYKTENLDNLAYILEQPELKQNKQFMFYILRDKEPYFGQLRFAERK